jgi:hypothetical protein
VISTLNNLGKKWKGLLKMEYREYHEQCLTKCGNYRIGRCTYKLKICKGCGKKSLIRKEGMFCSKRCRIFTEEHRKKLSVSNRRPLSEEAKIKIGISKKGDRCHFWKGGVSKHNIPLFETFGSRLELCEEIRNIDNFLEIRCTYCGKWFQPKSSLVTKRILFIEGKSDKESRLYCSKECKHNCPIFNRSEEDYLAASKVDKLKNLSREAQPELRKLVFARDNYECQRCGSNISLHCHHFEGIEHNPIESADVDMCITLCKECHKGAHSQNGCKSYDLRKCK